MLEHMVFGGASLLLIVKKSNGYWCLCENYRFLNAATIPDRYLFLHILDWMQILDGKTIFSILDLESAYYQNQVNPTNIPKTAVIIHLSLFQFPVMTSSSCNAAQSFQRFINKALFGLDFCIAYLDDVLLFLYRRKIT